MQILGKQGLSLILGVLVFAGLLWFFVSPLFIDVTVNEELVLAPHQGPAGMPTREDVLAMSDTERAATMARVMNQMAAEPDHVMDEAMVQAQVPEVIRRGNFRDADAIHRGAGEALIYRLPDGSHLVRLENFRVTNGPALVVYLARHPDPPDAAAVKEGFYDLGKLKGNVGNQNYRIPAGVDISEFNSVVIWCELFDVLFSPAALNEL